ncbi:MFS transporter [Salmonella enterica]|nr:MFS transporter [Salmonella enterica]
MITVALIDDHLIVRSGFAQLLGLEPDLQVVAEFGSGREALAGLPGRGVQVCICDISMPDISGLELLSQLPKGMATIMLSVHDSPALGGFWAMSASLTMRLVPARTVPKALSVIFGAVSIALVIAAPLGSFLGGIIGWRNVFNAAAVMGVLCVIWVVKSLPSLPGEPSHQKQNMFSLLQRPGVMAGMIAIFMSFAGQFAFFTYIRPVYMNLAGFDVDGLTLVLLSFGIASFVGTSFSSYVLKRSVKLALAGAPLLLALSALTLIVWGSDKTVAAAIAIIWGLAFALVPVGWSTWITRSLADQAEKAGSIQVAVIQLANTCGAAVGGYALDNFGLLSPLALSGGLMLLTALVVAAKVRITPMS